MAVDMFLKISEIPGESLDSKHKDEIDVLSFSWGVSQFGGSASGGGAGAGKADFQDFTFAVPVSKASPKLWLACASGKHYSDATLSVRRAGENQNDYLVYKLYDLLVTSYQEGASDDTGPLDSFSLNFSKIEVSYKQVDQKGGVGAETTAGWDLKKNEGG